MTVTTKASVTKRRPVWLRVVALICVVFTVWHIFATFLWVAPANEIRRAIPTKILSGYMNPMFTQSWSVFAPEPVNGDYSVEVRAILVDESGKRNTTDWVNAVNREMSLTHHNFFPARATLAGDKVASNYRKAWGKLNDNQQEAVEWNYYKSSDWLKTLQDTLKAKADGSASAIKNAQAFVDQERIATAYATQVARAQWGDSLDQVQFRVARRGIIPFKNRNDPDAVRPKPSSITSGWRGQLVIDGQNEKNFAKIFNGLEEVKR